MEVILTGLRTNADYHIGNYIGSLLPIKRLIDSKLRADPNRYQVNLFAPDLHSFTTPIDFAGLYKQTITNLRLMVAVGIPLDWDNVHIYRQSAIAAHSELTWILSNFSGFGEMARMVEFKDKSGRLGQDRVSVGLFSYPILMAADILLYGASWVPVGDDQRQHLEFCRNLASSFNQRFDADVFVVPRPISEQHEFVGQTTAARIRSLRQPQAKMSKSLDDPAGTIWLADDRETVSHKIKSAPTDVFGVIKYDWDSQPAITNLLTILARLSGRDQTSVNKEWVGQTSYASLKDAVTIVVNDHLNQIQVALEAVTEARLLEHLDDREKKMGLIANQRLRRVQELIGIRPTTP